jgi:hypothetical protein
MKKLLLPLLAMIAVIAPIPGKADAAIGYVVSTTCTSSVAQQAGGSYYICYDISAESVAVYRSTGSPNWTYTYQAGPFLTVNGRNVTPPAPQVPTTGAYFGSNECSGSTNWVGYGPGVVMQPPPTQNGWAGYPVVINQRTLASYYWSEPQLTASQITTLISYANSSIPSYRCITVP